MNLRHVTDWEGNPSTIATYTDDDGHPRSTKLNGYLNEQSVWQSILSHRRRVTDDTVRHAVEGTVPDCG